MSTSNPCGRTDNPPVLRSVDRPGCASNFRTFPFVWVSCRFTSVCSVCLYESTPSKFLESHFHPPPPHMPLSLFFFFIPCTTRRLAWLVFFTIETDTTVQTEQSSTNRDQIKSIIWSAGAKVFFWFTRRPNRTLWTEPPESS